MSQYVSVDIGIVHPRHWQNGLPFVCWVGLLCHWRVAVPLIGADTSHSFGGVASPDIGSGLPCHR